MVDIYFSDEVNEETMGSDARPLISPGLYFVRVADSRETADAIEVDFEICGGTKPDQVGNVYREYFKLKQVTFHQNKLNTFISAIGLLTDQQIVEARKNGQGLSFDAADFVDGFCCIEIENERKQKQDADGNWVADPDGKLLAKIPYMNIWHVDSKQVARLKIPIDRTLMEASDVFGGGSAAVGSDAAASKAKPKPVDDF